MAKSKFTADKDVRSFVKRAQETVEAKGRLSDLVDSTGNQYVDLVMEGGGMLGIALLGYTHVLEQCGIRFWAVGGTSAGSIVATLLAAWSDKQQAKSEELAAALAAADVRSFVDGDTDVQEFVDVLVRPNSWIGKTWKGIQVVDTLREDLGLNPGSAFEDWLKELLAGRGITTTEALLHRISFKPEGLEIKCSPETTSPRNPTNQPRLAVVAAEIGTETRVEFPEMAELFWKNPLQVHPARFVRASMSIPVFFKPLVLGKLPKAPELHDRWKNELLWEGKIPSKAVFVDGGTMSNFPIDLFHNHGVVPSHPTFGVKLGREKTKPTAIDGPIDLILATFNSARHTLDNDFIRKNPDYQMLVSCVDTEGHDWLNFGMGESDQLSLFQEGARTACEFLDRFSWDAYKEIRGHIASAVKRAGTQA